MMSMQMTMSRCSQAASRRASDPTSFIEPITFSKHQNLSIRVHVCNKSKHYHPTCHMSERNARIPATVEKDVQTLPAPSKLPPQTEQKHLTHAQILSERCSNTWQDAIVHFSQMLRQEKDTHAASAHQKHVVVLGSGWGAHALVKDVDMNQIKSITVISPRNYFFFTPLLSSTAVGTTDFRSITEPIKHVNPDVEFFEGYATDVDFERQIVHCESSRIDHADHNVFEVPYDVLAICVGETISTFGVDGVRQHAHFLKEIADAQRLRRYILDRFENASLPIWSDKERRRMLHFVIVGGGPTGCEFAGELADFIADDLPHEIDRKVLDLVQVTLLQSGSSLLPQFEESLRQVALENFRGRVSVELNSRVSKVDENSLALADGRQMDYGLLIWAAGNATRPITAKLVERLTGQPMDVALKRHMKLVVDPWLRVRGARNVFAVGDCATIEGAPLPANAQVAGQQGSYVARLISKAEDVNAEGPPQVRFTDGKEFFPFHYLSPGTMAYLGNDKAIIQFDASDKRHVFIWGRVAFILWRSIYAVKQFDIHNSMLVLFDWFKAKVFGRDVSQV